MPKALNVYSNTHPIPSSSLGRTLLNKHICYKCHTPSGYIYVKNTRNEKRLVGRAVDRCVCIHTSCPTISYNIPLSVSRRGGIKGGEVYPVISLTTKSIFIIPFQDNNPQSPPLRYEGVSQLCFDFVAAIFRLRKLLEFNKRFSQTKVCGYKKPNYDTVSTRRGGLRG